MYTLLVNDTLYTLLTVIEAVECVCDVRGVIIRAKFGERTYTIYGFKDVNCISVNPHREEIHIFYVDILAYIDKHKYLNLVELQTQLGKNCIYCNLICLNKLRRWRREYSILI